jgi:hypothetical protein
MSLLARRVAAQDADHLRRPVLPTLVGLHRLDPGADAQPQRPDRLELTKPIRLIPASPTRS